MANRLLIIPTKKCDLRCTHCMRDNFKSESMPPELLDRFVTEIKKRNKNIVFSLTGGEPTIHTQFDEFLSVFEKHQAKFSVISNGINADGRNTIIKHKKNCNVVLVSLDAPSAEINDIVRGKGSFEKAINSVVEYSKAGVPVFMKFVMHDDNVEEMLTAYDLALELAQINPKNPPGVTIASLHQSTRRTSNPDRNKSLARGEDLTVSDKIRDAFNELLRLKTLEKYKNLKITLGTRNYNFREPFADWRREPCGNVQNYQTKPEEHIVFLPDGKISYCCDLYDFDFDHSRYQDAGTNDPINHIIGDFTVESLDTILETKQKHTIELLHRRVIDYSQGLLVGDRANVCDNCKFYHHQPKQEGKNKYPIFAIQQLK